MNYSFDPELVAWIGMIPATDITDYKTTWMVEAELVAQRPKYTPSIPLYIRDATIPGPAGAPDVPVRIYRPEGKDEPLPAMVYIHGGGFITGSVPVFDTECQRLAAEIEPSTFPTPACQPSWCCIPGPFMDPLLSDAAVSRHMVAGLLSALRRALRP
jgi:hypothetical protein